MKHKFLSILCATAIVAALTACTSDEEPDTIYEDTTATPGINSFDHGLDGGSKIYNGDETQWDRQDNVLDPNASKSPWDNPSKRLDLGFPVIYFAYDSDALGESEVAKLQQVASYLQQNAAVGVIIEGHCDERGTEEYNRALGERRAISVKNYFSGMGIPEERVRTISFGEDRPAVQGSGESSWRMNRRGELVGIDLR